MPLLYTLKVTPNTHLFSLATLSGNQSLSVIGQVQLGNDDLGGVNVDGDRGTVRLFLLQLFELDGELKSVDRRDLAFLALLGTSDNSDGVFLSDGKSRDTVLFLQFLGEGSRHHLSSFDRRRGEVSLSGLTARGRNV